MAKVYDKIIEVRAKDDNTYTISLQLSDSSIVIRTAVRADLEKLQLALKSLLVD